MSPPHEAADAEDRPDARQVLHAVTGDRDAEARAVAERADEDVDAAKTAVGQAHGDIAGRTKPESDLATADDVHDAARREDDD
jgi:hypothetical protein